MKFKYIAIFLLILVFRPSFIFSQINSKGLDDIFLLLEEASMVITASKFPQKIIESPATIHIITKEDIKMSGAENIPDLLRLVNGIDVMQIVPSHIEVNARGFNQLFSNRMLVLIDNRSVYGEFFGEVKWQSFPISLDEIKKIEVINGAGSVLYGANAFSGIINIITVKPEELEGTYASFSGGSQKNFSGTVINGGKFNHSEYKISLGGEYLNTFENSRPAVNNRRFDIFYKYKIGPLANIITSAGINSLRYESYGRDLSIFSFNNHQSDYIKLNYKSSSFNIKNYWNQVRFSNKIRYSLFDTELQKMMKIFQKHFLVYGLNVRYKKIESSLIDNKHSQVLAGGYIQDNLSFNQFIFNLGLRYDYHPLTKNNISIRGSLIYTFSENHNFRLSASTAFRNPSFYESYQSVFFQDQAGINNFVLGNKELDPEKIDSYEAVYQNLLIEKLNIRISLFYNLIRDFITFEDPEFIAADKIVLKRINKNNAISKGGELEFSLHIKDNIKTFIGYSFQYITDQDERIITSYPRNKVNAGININLKDKPYISIFSYFVDKTRWLSSQQIGGAFGKELGNVPSYFIINTILGYKFDLLGNLKISISNLFDNKHKEYPIGEEIGRKFTLKWSLKY